MHKGVGTGCLVSLQKTVAPAGLLLCTGLGSFCRPQLFHTDTMQAMIAVPQLSVSLCVDKADSSSSFAQQQYGSAHLLQDVPLPLNVLVQIESSH